MGLLLIEMWGVGTTPMLLNRATEEALSGSTRANTPGEEINPRDVAEKCVYRLPSAQLALPGSAMARMIREAGGNHKAKGSRKTLKYLVPAAVLVLDDLMGLYLNDRRTKVIEFEVDSRPVTIPATKGRIMRHRARLNEWAFRCQLRINDAILNEDMVRRLVVEGLTQIGLGDFRPEKGGPFGTGDVVSWKAVGTGKQSTAAQTFAAGRPAEAAE